jgi:hypothetical protein
MLGLFRRNRATRQGQALATLDAAAERFRQAAERLTGARADLFWDLAEGVERLRGHIADSADHLNPLRRLWVFFVPHTAAMAVDWAAAWADPKHGQDGPQDAAGLDHFRGFLAVLHDADLACRMRRYDRLEAATRALEAQLARTRP